MAFQTVSDVNAAIAAGRYYKTSWMKTVVGTYTAGRWYNTYLLGGVPAAGTYPGAAQTFSPLYGTSGSWGGATNYGSIPCGQTVGTAYTGNNWFKHLLNVEVSAISGNAGAPGWLLLVDLLGYYAGMDMSSGSQQGALGGGPMTNVGTQVYPRYANGVGVMAFLEVTTATGGTTSALSTALSVPANGFTYTNSAGVGSRYIPGTVAYVASSAVQSIVHSGTVVNTFGPFLPLAAGDQGIQSVQYFQNTIANSGQCAIVMCKPLASIPLISVTSPNITAVVRDFLFNMPGLPRIEDGACLSFLYCPGAGATATPAIGTLEFVWG